MGDDLSARAQLPAVRKEVLPRAMPSRPLSYETAKSTRTAGKRAEGLTVNA
jgi:hypothetical protein